METVFQALARLRQESNADRAVYFYVTDADERLVGIVPARRLLFAEPAALVGEIMVHPVVSVTEGETFGAALALLAEQRLLALPVVDEQNRLIGTLDISGFTHTIWHLEQLISFQAIHRLQFWYFVTFSVLFLSHFCLATVW